MIEPTYWVAELHPMGHVVFEMTSWSMIRLLSAFAIGDGKKNEEGRKEGRNGRRYCTKRSLLCLEWTERERKKEE